MELKITDYEFDIDEATDTEDIPEYENSELFSHKWSQFESGEIDLIDLLFSPDLIREHKENEAIRKRRFNRSV